MSLAAAPPTSDRMRVSSKPSQNSSSKSGPRSKRTFIDSLNLSRERESPSLMRSKKPIGHSFKIMGDGARQQRPSGRFVKMFLIVYDIECPTLPP